MQTVRNYLSLIKFSHTIFAMPFAIIGFCLAIFPGRNYLPSGWSFRHADPTFYERMVYFVNQNLNHIYFKLLFVILCMVFARSAAMAFNRYLDKNFDALNPRTAIREIPAGIISANSALWFTIICSFLFMVCAFLINQLCFLLSPVALLVILGYSYTKRFTALCHLLLGLGLSLAPIGAYLAVTGEFDIFSLRPVFFSLTVLCWVSGFDIIYSLQDEEFDKQNNLHSIPAALGKKTALRISQILHFFAALFVIAAGWLFEFTIWYWIGAAIFIGMLIYQHSIVKPNDLRRVNLAFMTANGIASVVFAVFVITDLAIRSGGYINHLL